MGTAQHCHQCKSGRRGKDGTKGPRGLVGKWLQNRRAGALQVVALAVRVVADWVVAVVTAGVEGQVAGGTVVE